MNTLDIAKQISTEDVELAKLLHFTYRTDCGIDGLKDEVEKVCKEKGFSHELADTVFALTYARLKK